MTEDEHDRYALRIHGAAFPGIEERLPEAETQRALELKAMTIASLVSSRSLTIFDLVDDELVETEGRARPVDG